MPLEVEMRIAAGDAVRPLYEVTERMDYEALARTYKRRPRKGEATAVNRSIQAEGTFGVLKQAYGFRRFLHRGEGHVFTEVLLYAMAYNLDKLHAEWCRNRSGCTLHLLSSA